ncbi:glycine cleavage system protein R [Paraglaciecola polaris]|uniref:Glycine cleavage system transcriptional repressor n=1 Tax=Paraglaciecola polaris LMG 21857 TaxID=1129793 RepID=K6ZCJ1_9ALTE|nr:ACT domain-containing protein [Paraglaciecola polaris]GAC33786.1 glycine cleavage system transcriptional repressor [Paraglaciecola polaris LMG 21857]
MKQQLIITILGANKPAMLSTLADAVSEAGCNILDSRQAVYGQDFSLTMIVEGTQSAIVRVEMAIPVACQQLDLLSMLKRTKRHAKQNLEHLADVEFSGADAVGVIKEVTQFFSTFCVTVSALRLKTLQTSLDDDAQVKCKMVVSMPHNVDLVDFECQFHSLLSTLHLNGAIKQKN